MPIYWFHDLDTGKEWSEEMTIAEFEERRRTKPPNVQSVLRKATMIGDPHRLGLKKPDEGFRDRLKDIKKAHIGSTINTW